MTTSVQIVTYESRKIDVDHINKKMWWNPLEIPHLVTWPRIIAFVHLG